MNLTCVHPSWLRWAGAGRAGGLQVPSGDSGTEEGAEGLFLCWRGRCLFHVLVLLGELWQDRRAGV